MKHQENKCCMLWCKQTVVMSVPASPQFQRNAVCRHWIHHGTCCVCDEDNLSTETRQCNGVKQHNYEYSWQELGTIAPQYKHWNLWAQAMVNNKIIHQDVRNTWILLIRNINIYTQKLLACVSTTHWFLPVARCITCGSVELATNDSESRGTTRQTNQSTDPVWRTGGSMRKIPSTCTALTVTPQQTQNCMQFQTHCM